MRGIGTEGQNILPAPKAWTCAGSKTSSSPRMSRTGLMPAFTLWAMSDSSQMENRHLMILIQHREMKLTECAGAGGLRWISLPRSIAPSGMITRRDDWRELCLPILAALLSRIWFNRGVRCSLRGFFLAIWSWYPGKDTVH